MEPDLTATDPAPPAESDADEDAELIEEISIDGMCGVY
jgi:mycofactocin precursor